MDFKVGVFDSGIGGLSILSELEKVLPNEDFYYYGDSLNNPYGEKSDEEFFTEDENVDMERMKKLGVIK